MAFLFHIAQYKQWSADPVTASVSKGLVVLWAVTPCSLVNVYQRFWELLPPPSGWKKTDSSSETLVTTYRNATSCDNPDARMLKFHRPDRLISHISG
jgi:hypothetical protein